MLSVFSIFKRVDPYIPILFLLISLLILYKYYQNHRLLYKQIQNIDVNYSLKENYVKFLETKRLVNGFVLQILVIEIAINLIGSAGWLAVDNMNYLRPSSTNISNSCQISHNTNLVGLTHVKSWGLYFLTRIVEVISLLLLPTICYALDVIRCAILSHTYAGSVKKWRTFIIVRSIILLVLSNTFYTYVLFVIFQIILFWLDILLYFIYARRLYRVLKSRREAAQIQFRNSNCLSTKLEYEQYRQSAIHFKISTCFTFFLEIVLILQVTINSLLFLLMVVLTNSCYFSFLTFGYVESIQFRPGIIHFVDKVKSPIYMVTLSLSYTHQLLMSIAYILLLCLVNRCLPIKRNNHQLLQQNIKTMIKNTYETYQR